LANVLSVKQSTHATRRRKEEVFEDFLCDLFSGALTDKLVQRVSGGADIDEMTKLHAFSSDADKVNAIREF
jgi:hypothetical protein